MYTAEIKTQRVHNGYHSWVAIYEVLPGGSKTKYPLFEMGGVTHSANTPTDPRLFAIATRWSDTPIVVQATDHMRPSMDEMYKLTLDNIRTYIKSNTGMKIGTVANYLRRIAFVYQLTHHQVFNDLMKC